jgi:hypothetical protein
MTTLILIGLMSTKTGSAIVTRILSAIFPPEEPTYHIYRYATKGIAVPRRYPDRIWTWKEN